MKNVIFFLVFSLKFVFSQQVAQEFHAPYIKSLQIINSETQQQDGIWTFGQKLSIQFDDIQNSYKRYYYTIEHCDRNWIPSNLMESEYLQGYFYEEIRNYKYSFNTQQSYVHYRFEFPSEKMKPKISGNFLLKIYSDKKTNPVAIRKIFFQENNVQVSVNQELYNAGSISLPNQKIMVMVNSSNLNLNDFGQNFTLTLMQNDVKNGALMNIVPHFFENKRLKFNHFSQVFFGNNEYLFFDTKNKSINGITTEKIIQENGLTQNYLYMNYPNPIDYNYNPDANGSFFIRRNDIGEERNGEIEADYIWVNFALKNTQLPKGEYYVVGGFNDYQLTEENKMKLINDDYYEIGILLKQGYYNYCFAYKDEKGNVKYNTLNGNFWQTKNKYTALIYYKNFNENFDRLAGIGYLNEVF